MLDRLAMVMKVLRVAKHDLETLMVGACTCNTIHTVVSMHATYCPFHAYGFSLLQVEGALGVLAVRMARRDAEANPHPTYADLEATHDPLRPEHLTPRT